MSLPKALMAIIIAHLRRIGYRNTTYKAAMSSAHRGYGQWQCCQCKKITDRKDLHGDHIQPVVDPALGFTNWDSYIERLFMGQIQPLCKVCHKAKTKEENILRKEVKSKWEIVE